MTSWIDRKYISLIGSQLEQFQVISSGASFQARFRCPFCGDSKINPYKKRGNIFEGDGGLYFKCFNCGHATNVQGLLKHVNRAIYNEYLMETLKEKSTPNKDFKSEIFTLPVFNVSPNELRFIKPVSSLSNNHPTKKYIKSRLIPEYQYNRLYHCDKFYHWVNKVIPDKFSGKLLNNDGPRLLIPFIDEYNTLFGVQGRSFDDIGVRYLSIMFDKNKVKIFGLDKIDKNKHIYIVEGPIDSLFLDNSLAFAAAEADLTNISSKNNITIIMDNEPRNKEIVNIMNKYISDDYNVCIWPNGTKGKDINDMILMGLTKEKIQNIIQENTFRGLKAMNRMREWNRI